MERSRWIAAVLLASASLAQAQHPGIFVSQKYVGSVTVVSDGGQVYDRIQGKTYPLSMQAGGVCGEGETVHDASLKSLTWPGSDSQIDVSELRASEKSFTVRPVLVPYSLTPVEWNANWKQRVLEACNQNLMQQMNARHWTPQQVFARDWTLDDVSLGQVEGLLACNDKKARFEVKPFDSSGVPTYRMQVTGRVKVICGKHQFDDFAAPKKPKTPTDDLTYGVHVVQANLAILPKTGGSGPCGVTLSGVIETDAINTTVTFFYRNNKGGTTPWRSVKTDHSKTAFFSDFIEFDKPGVGGGFVNPMAGSPGPAGNTFAATPSTKDFNGTYQIVGKNIAFESNVGHFAFNCAAPPVNGFAGTPKPGTPTNPNPNPSPNPNPNTPGTPTSPGTPTLPGKPVAKPLKARPQTP